jgi:hypothetical protein
MLNMSRFRFSTREIGSVKVYDLEGDPSQENVQDIAWKIQRSIRRHRLQRVILNVQRVHSLDDLAVRKLVAAFLRPQRSAIYGASSSLSHQLEGTYLPKNMKLCPTEREIAEDLGPFLFHKEEIGHVLGYQKDHPASGETPGMDIERRRSKRMHVAIPLELTLSPEGKPPILTQGISTNISEGGIFVEYLDLNALDAIEALDPLEGIKAEIQIHPSGNFPEEYHLEGLVQRKEQRKRGIGLAVQFLEQF